MIRNILLLGALLLLSACAQQMTHEDYNNIKKVAVVSSVKDELGLYNRGLTIFGKALTKADITPWKLSSYLTQQTLMFAQKGNPSIDFKEVNVAKDKFVSRELLPADVIKKLQADGFDTALVIQNAGIYKAAGGGSYLAEPEVGGFILYTTSFMEKTWHNQLFPQFTYILYRLSDLKHLGYSSNSMTYPKEIKTLPTKPFDQYSDEEKELIKNELIKNMDATIAPNVSKLFVVSPKQ